MAIELKVPSVGESVVEVQIGRWLKQEGDAVAADEPLVEIETDKVTQELPAPVAGRLGRIIKPQGETARVGDVIGAIEEGVGAPAAPAPAAPDRKHKGEKGAKVKSGSKPDATEQDRGGERDALDTAPKSGPETARIMPAAQRILSQNKLPPEDVQGSGPGGRILKEDAQRAAEARSGGDVPEPAPRAGAAASSDQGKPVPKPSGAREEQAVPMSPIRRRIAQRLVQAQHETASLTTYNEIDMHAVMELRARYKESFEKKHGVKLGFMSFFVKASIEALKAFPAVNAELRGSDIVYKNYYDIGIAIGSGKGLVVPVLRSADRMSMAEVEKAIGAYAKKVQENKLALEDLQGGTFTITNGGIYGSMMSTPILNPPQSGILGMHAINDRPVAVGGEVRIRPVMYIALTYDHRIVDGREAVSFLKTIKDTLEDPARLLLEV